MRNIKVDINQYGVLFDKYKNEIESVIDKTLKELDLKIQKKLLDNMKKYNIDSANVTGSIKTKIIDNKLMIMVNCEYAVFLEYGTGVVGGLNQHPDISNVNWIYSDGGWWYPTTAEKQQRYPKQPTRLIGGKLYAFTLGQSSKPFMYDTWLWAKNIVDDVFKKNLKNFTS